MNPEDWTKLKVTNSVRMLCRVLSKACGRKTILLIDEYGVPLQKAWIRGENMYRQMTELIRGIFSEALKTNEYLDFAVLTGCLRVSQESIFTWLNNVKVFSITDPEMNEYFGFTDGEVRQMLKDYNAMELYDLTKEWYDGYQFGEVNVYCPWDMILWCQKIRSGGIPVPECYWANSSGNDIVRELLAHASAGERNRISDELDTLLSGGTVTKEINQQLTYSDMTRDLESIWNTLFLTGYLTPAKTSLAKELELKIPNQEVREIYTEQIRAWVKRGDFSAE